MVKNIIIVDRKILVHTVRDRPGSSAVMALHASVFLAVFSILMTSTAASKKKVTDRKPAELWRTSATPRCSSDTAMRGAGRTDSCSAVRMERLCLMLVVF